MVFSNLDVETSAFGAATSAITRRPFDATISALDAETSALDAEMSAIARSYWQYRCGVFGDCGVGVSPQMCNRVTTHGDMGTFFRNVHVYLESRIFITFFNISSFTAHIQRFWNANNEYCSLCENIYLSEVSTFSYLLLLYSK